MIDEREENLLKVKADLQLVGRMYSTLGIMNLFFLINSVANQTLSLFSFIGLLAVYICAKTSIKNDNILKEVDSQLTQLERR